VRSAPGCAGRGVVPAAAPRLPALLRGSPLSLRPPALGGPRPPPLRVPPASLASASGDALRPTAALRFARFTRAASRHASGKLSDLNDNGRNFSIPAPTTTMTLTGTGSVEGSRRKSHGPAKQLRGRLPATQRGPPVAQHDPGRLTHLLRICTPPRNAPEIPAPPTRDGIASAAPGEQDVEPPAWQRPKTAEKQRNSRPPATDPPAPIQQPSITRVEHIG